MKTPVVKMRVSKSMIRRTAVYTAAALMIITSVIILLLPEYKGDLDDFGEGTVILSADGTVLRRTLGSDETESFPVEVEACGEWTVRALIAAEDKRFLSHFGIDPAAMLRATAQNIINRRVVSGASTISTLVVKLTEPRERNIGTKLIEAKHAMGIEQLLSKEEIAEQYINRAPYGGTIYGIEAASQAYFGRSASTLSLPESALLVGLPQSPSRLRPDRYPEKAKERRQYVLRNMLKCGMISDEQFKQASHHPVEVIRRSSPFIAPHFTDFILRRFPGEKRIETTLDLSLQSSAEAVLKRHMEKLRRRGIGSGAIVIIDVKNSSIAAMVGSDDFFEKTSGQVNGAAAKRSPGSTLKPFAFAMALDQGILTPGSIIEDIPADFSGYRPENFNHKFAGPVTVRRALVESLNIPALRCTADVGLERVIGRLKEAGISTLDKTASEYGLSLILGTCEVTLLELCNSYACLAREGIYSPLQLIKTEEKVSSTRLFSKEAAYMISDILSGDERALESDGHIADVQLPRSAWKTGTSSGSRDAWTVAYNPEYVIGVWVGNADGTPCPSMSGLTCAAPVTREIFRSIYGDSDSPWYAMPKGLKEREVCSVSGNCPGEFCTAPAADLYIAGISITKTCSSHRKEKGSVMDILPGATAAFLKQHGMSDNRVNPQEHSCSLAITHPSDGATFLMLNSNVNMDEKIKLTSRNDSDGDIFWFVDGKLYSGSDSKEEIWWNLTKGEHTFTCSDENGISDSVSITVQ